MPKQRTHYNCEYCPQSFPTRRTCLEHECKEHLHISIETYEKWQGLKRAVETTSHTVSMTKNLQTEAAFDKAIEELMKFEKKYNLNPATSMTKSKLNIQTITAITRDGTNFSSITIICRINSDDENFDLKTAVQAAVKDYLHTYDGKEKYEYNLKTFTWTDFITYIDNTFCKPHGFEILSHASNTNVDADEELVDEFEFNEFWNPNEE